MHYESSIEPLKIPEILRVPPATTRFGGKRIPILTRYVSHWRNVAWARQVRAELENQLNARPDSVVRLWNENPNYRRVLASFLTILQKRIGWPYPRFIPVDPLNLVLWSQYLDLEVVEIIFEVEQTILKSKIPNDCAESIKQNTIGNFVDWLVQAMPKR